MSYSFIALLCGAGVGIGLAAAILTYRHASPPIAEATDAQRQDALERFKIWNDFWKYFLVSFALVLITSLLGNILKERELAMQKAKQDSDLALATASAATANLIAENENLGHFLSNALVDSLDKQYAFASYFSHLTSNADAQKRWEGYATFIKEQREEFLKHQSELTKNDIASAKLAPGDPKRIELEEKREELQAKLALNKAILQIPNNLTIKDVNLTDGGTLFEAGMMIDVDGGPHAYHPDGKSGLDSLANAGKPGNWWELVTDNGKSDGNPVIQGSSDPAPGFYIALTSLQDVTKSREDPRRYVDSELFPYIDVPRQLSSSAGVRLGDFAVVLNTKNQKLCYAIVAGYGPANQIGIGSIALAKALEINANPKTGGAGDGIIYKIFPGSATGWPKAIEEINAEGERLLKPWGGQQRLLKELAGRSNLLQPK
jgi:hypothetical protein